MSSLTMILLIVGLIFFVMYLFTAMMKVKGAFIQIGLLLAGLIFVIGSLVNTLLEVKFFDQIAAPKVSEAVVKQQEPENTKPTTALLQQKAETNQGEDEPVVKAELPEKQEVPKESVPQQIARDLVKQEMAKQEGVKSWSITDNTVTSDEEVYNIADYDKPEGNMRIVWVSGNVNATTEEDDITGNVGYELELYQLEGEDTWRIGNHWGVLINVEVTEYEL